MTKTFDNSETSKANEIAKFLFNKKNENLVTNDFISVILQQSGDVKISNEINNFSAHCRYILRKINSAEHFLIVKPAILKKFGHIFF